MTTQGENLITVAKKYLFKHERTNNTMLKNFLGLDPARIPWCASFINACLGRIAVKGTGSNLARSFLKLKSGRKVRNPRRGDIVVFRRGFSSWQGHVGIYMGETPTHIRSLGGNQSNAVNYSLYPKKKLLGYIRLKEIIRIY